MKGSWVTRDSLEGILCLYDPNDQSKRAVFFSSHASFICQWGCRDFTILGDFNVVLNGDTR